MRSFKIIIGSVSFFEKKLQALDVKGEEFNEVITAFDTARSTGAMPEKAACLIVRNNHYHAIVESAHARLGGLIEDVTTEEAQIFIHNPTSVLLRYIRREHESKHCQLKEIKEPRSSLSEIAAVRSKIENIKKQIIGQENALEEIAKTLNYLASTRRQKPYVLMLYGKSSLGKTETAKAIADAFFDGKMIERHLLLAPGDFSHK